MLGYDRIPPTPGAMTERLRQRNRNPGRGRPARRLARRARLQRSRSATAFVDPSLQAAIDPGASPVTLANPIASDLAVLRTSLWPGLLAAARHNLSHQRMRLKLFEIGSEFSATADGVRETAALAGLLMGTRAPEHWDGAGQNLDFFDAKGDFGGLAGPNRTRRRIRFRARRSSGVATRASRAHHAGRARRSAGSGRCTRDLQGMLDRRRETIVFALQLDATFATTVPAFQTCLQVPVHPSRPRDRRR